MKAEEFRYIRSIEDIRLLKAALRKKAVKKEKKILKRIGRIKQTVTPGNILAEITGKSAKADLITTLMPIAIQLGTQLLGQSKYAKGLKWLLPMLGGLGAALMAYLGFKKKQNTTEE